MCLLAALMDLLAEELSFWNVSHSPRLPHRLGTCSSHSITYVCCRLLTSNTRVRSPNPRPRSGEGFLYCGPSTAAKLHASSIFREFARKEISSAPLTSSRIKSGGSCRQPSDCITSSSKLLLLVEKMGLCGILRRYSVSIAWTL